MVDLEEDAETVSTTLHRAEGLSKQVLSGAIDVRVWTQVEHQETVGVGGADLLNLLFAIELTKVGETLGKVGTTHSSESAEYAGYRLSHTRHIGVVSSIGAGGGRWLERMRLQRWLCADRNTG